jgi:hypothetical protein
LLRADALGVGHRIQNTLAACDSGEMMKACALAVFAAMLWGCATPTASWKGEVKWPDEHSARLVLLPMEAGAALAAAGAIREMIRTNPHPRLFRGCTSPEQGLDVVVFTDPTSGLYYVVLHPRFDRCGGPVGRVLDGWDAYAVTPQGEVVAKAPPPSGEAPGVAPIPVSPPTSTPEPPSPEQTLPPPAQTPTPADPPSSPGANPPVQTPPSEFAPATPPPAGHEGRDGVDPGAGHQGVRGDDRGEPFGDSGKRTK